MLNMAQLVESIENHKMEPYDFGLSFLYHKIISDTVIAYSNGNIINFHPAPVQIHKGIGTFCYCLLKGYSEWGGTAHFLTSGIDSGDIIKQRFFKVPENCSAMELEKIQQDELNILFDEVLEMIVNDESIPRQPQDLSLGVYYSQKDLDKEKIITLEDTSKEIDRKIRALWYPPFHGASIVIDGKRYSLINEEMLKEIASLYEMKKMRMIVH